MPRGNIVFKTVDRRKLFSFADELIGRFPPVRIERYTNEVILFYSDNSKAVIKGVPEYYLVAS
jgi:hypothetical protein